MEEWIEYYLNSNPEIATMNGYIGYESRYSQFTPVEDYKMAINCLNKINEKDNLSLEEQYTLEVLNNHINEYLLCFHYIPFNHQENPINNYIEMSSDGFVPLKNDYNWKSHIARIDYFVIHINNLIHWSGVGIQNNYLPIKIDVEKMIKTIEDIIRNGEYINKRCGSVSDSVYSEYLSVAKKKLLPCIIKFLEYLKSLIYNGLCRDSIGLLNINENGINMYRFLIRKETGLLYSEEEIYNIGMSEIGRIKIEMEKIRDEMGYSHLSLYDFNKILKDEVSGDNIISIFKKLRKVNKRVIKRNFYSDVTRDCKIKKCPPHMEGQSVAYYWDPSIEPFRDGIFYINTGKNVNNSSHQFLALSLHEDTPGHHFHFQFLSDIDCPVIYRLFPSNGFVEGWGLYCESLGDYSDKRDLFGRLMFDMLRSCRLVIDIGLHYYGISRDDAINFLNEHTLMDMTQNKIEVDRYIAIPGQALSYKLGEIKIKELRKRCKGMGKSRLGT